MKVQVRIPGALREYAGGSTELEVDARTVQEALMGLVTAYPVLRRHLFDDRGTLRGHVNVFLNENDVRYGQGLSTPLRKDDIVTIVPSVAGGQTVTDLSAEEMARYSRHLSLPDVGIEGQRKLKAAKVAIVGAGGLGSPSSLYLAAAGIGRIGLIDFDTIDVTNLQRQVLFRSDQVGESKARTAAVELRRLNPQVEVVVHETRLTRENALDVLAPYDVIIDGTDNFPTRYLVNDACVLLGKPYIYGSILRFDGQLSVFDAQRGPCYRCLFREPPPPGLVPNCAEAGVLGVLPGIIGAGQALEAMKWILGLPGVLAGRLQLFDALTFRWREMTLRKHPDCPVCGPNPTITGLIDYDEFCGVKPAMENNGTEIPETSVEEVKARLDSGERVQLLDVREPFEWEIANLGEYGAKLIPLNELRERLSELDPNREVLVYCRSGARSQRAAEILKSNGFGKVTNIAGGILAWADRIDPSKPKY